MFVFRAIGKLLSDLRVPVLMEGDGWESVRGGQMNSMPSLFSPPSPAGRYQVTNNSVFVECQYELQGLFSFYWGGR